MGGTLASSRRDWALLFPCGADVVLGDGWRGYCSFIPGLLRRAFWEGGFLGGSLRLGLWESWGD